MAVCKGCGKQILWTKMQSGRAMPCDPEFIHFSKGGNEVFVTPDGYVIHGTRKADGDLVGYVSHFATCRQAQRFKERG